MAVPGPPAVMINAVSNTWKPQIVATTIAKIRMRRISGKVRYQNRLSGPAPSSAAAW